MGNKIREYVGIGRRAGSKSEASPCEKLLRRLAEKPQVITIDLKSNTVGEQTGRSGNCVPGDAIYIPQADIASWRDVIAIATQLVVLQKLFD